MVCGWYSNQTLDPAYMEATASENVWFKHIEQVLRWSVNRNNVDNDREVSYVHVDDHSMKKVVKSYEKKRKNVSREASVGSKDHLSAIKGAATKKKDEKIKIIQDKPSISKFLTRLASHGLDKQSCMEQYMA